MAPVTSMIKLWIFRNTFFRIDAIAKICSKSEKQF